MRSINRIGQVKLTKLLPFLLSVLYFLCFQIIPYIHFHYVDDHGMLLSAHPVNFMDSDHAVYVDGHDGKNHDQNGQQPTDVHDHGSGDHIQIDTAPHTVYKIVKWGEPSPAITYGESVTVSFIPSQAFRPSDGGLEYQVVSTFAFHGRSPPKPA